MKKITVALIILSVSTFCMADKYDKSFDKTFNEVIGHAISMGPDGVDIAGFKYFTWDEWNKFIGDNMTFSINDPFDKSESKMYKCAKNDWVYPQNIYTDEVRKKMADDLANARFSEIGRASKKFDGEVNVYFEILGRGFTVSEKKQIEKEIQEAIQKILDEHFDK